MRSITVILLVILLPLAAGGVEVKHKGVRVSGNEQTADSLLSQADDVFQSQHYEAALEKYTEVVQTAHKEFNRSVEVEALSQVARMNLVLGNREEGETWLGRAADRASESDPMGWSRYLGVKGRFEWKADDLKQARATFDQMFEFCHANALWGRAVDAAHMIAIVAESPEEQIEWGRRGIEAAEAGDVESWLGPLWNNLAGTYYDLKQFDSALECYTKAREYHWRFSGEVGKLFADYHVGTTHRLLGNFDKAGKWLRPVLAWAERIENHSAIGQACADLGEIEIAKDNKAAGLKLLRRARDEYKKEGYDTSWPEVWEQINKRISEVQ